MCSWIVLATSWNILSGYSGYFSFGHGAFFGVGVYATATLAGRFEWPFVATLPMAALAASAIAVLLGALVFRLRRLRGELFALLTLAVTFIVATIILNTPIDGGPGVYLNAVAVPHLAPTPSGSFYLMSLAAAAATLALAWAIARSRLGAGLFAIHDDEDVAEVIGVPTFRYKLSALAIASALAGIAGALQALFVAYVTVAETFSIIVPLTVVLMSALGGSRHWAGPAVGAAVITLLSYLSTAGDHVLAGKAAVGALLIAVILFMPDGLLGRLARAHQRRAATGATSSPADAQAPVRVLATKPAPALLSLRDVRKAFAGVVALDGVGFDVAAGELIALLGPNGSGKSTLINVVSGHYVADSGRIDFDGRELQRLRAHAIARLGLARTYQIPRPFANLSVLENVTLTALFGSAHPDRAAATREARRWLDFTGLAAKADALPDDLNLHQRKFLELARALAARPRLLMLDEVLSGLTPTEVDAAVALVRRIHDGGTTIVLVEHVLRAVMALAQRVVVLDQGRVIADGEPGAVMRQPAVMRAYLGREVDAAA
jgi:branched-chain amino acid transport system permease protein